MGAQGVNKTTQNEKQTDILSPKKLQSSVITTINASPTQVTQEKVNVVKRREGAGRYPIMILRSSKQTTDLPLLNKDTTN